MVHFHHGFSNRIGVLFCITHEHHFFFTESMLFSTESQSNVTRIIYKINNNINI
jgi:hypothetical protein